MSQFTGILGTKASQLGNFVLGLGPAAAGTNSQTVNEAISLAETITVAVTYGPLDPHIFETVTVTPTITFNREIVQSVTSAITVTPSITDVLDTHIFLTQEVVEVIYNVVPVARLTQQVIEVVYKKPILITVTDTITVTPSVTPSGDRTAFVTDNVAVTSTPTGRNNIIRITLTQSITLSNPTGGRDTSNHELLNDSITVNPTAASRSDNPRQSIITLVTVAPIINARNTNPRISLTDGIVVSTLSVAAVPNFTVPVSIAVTETLGYRNTNPRLTVTDSVTLTETISDRNTNPRLSVTDTISVPQFFPNPIQAYNSNNRISVFDFVSVVDSVQEFGTHQYVESVVTLTDYIHKSYANVSVADYVTVTDSIGGGNSHRTITVTDTVATTDAISERDSIQRITVTDRVTVTPKIAGQGPIVLQSVTDSIHTSATPESRDIAIQKVHDLVLLNDAITIGTGNKNQAVTDSVTVTPTIRDSPINVSVTTSATVGERIRQLDITVTDTVSVSQIANKTADLRLSDALTFTESASGPKIMTHTLTDTLVPSETLARSIVWNRSLSDLIEFPDQYYIRATSISPDPIVVPIAVGTIVSATIVVLRSDPGGAIVLPAPLFDDSIGNVAGITIRRTMNGGAYSFIKSSDRQKLVWTFKIAQSKAIELRKWITKSISEVIRITDWQGRVWTAKLTSNPPTLSADGRFAPEVEYTNVELTFDAVKISG